MILSNKEREFLKTKYGLSPRELDIVALLLEGVESKKALGEKLGISPLTVGTLINRVFNKMQVHSKLSVVVEVVDTILPLRV